MIQNRSTYLFKIEGDAAKILQKDKKKVYKSRLSYAVPSIKGDNVDNFLKQKVDI